MLGRCSPVGIPIHSVVLFSRDIRCVEFISGVIFSIQGQSQVL